MRNQEDNNEGHKQMSGMLSMQLPKQWGKPILALFFLTLGSIFAFWDSWHSIVKIWWNSDTYAHGFLVAPISLWLIVSRRNQYKDLWPRPSYLALFILLGFGFVWLAASLTHVLVVEQWALVGLLICAYWVILGNQVYAKMLFPILFLFLMVPFGEDFVPFLMEFTATFVVNLLRLTGISVYREGLHFTLTSGNWSVVDACSGIRYLIASFTLGAVYAYLNYSSNKKRLIFMLAAVLVPILANGLRAYMIVMIGHLSDMKLATGVDHIIYGWVFFGLVMLLLFYIGSFWQDPFPVVEDSNSIGNFSAQNGYHNFWPMLLITLLGLMIWPVAATQMLARQATHVEIPASLISQAGLGMDHSPDWGWQPQFNGVVAEAHHYLNDGDSVVAMYLANFGDESQGGELVNSQNVLLSQKNKDWRMMRTAKAQVAWSNQPTDVDESVLSSGRRDLLVWRWYRVGSTNTANTYYAKWLQLLKRVSGDASPELLIVIYAEAPHGDYQLARDKLNKIALACCG